MIISQGDTPNFEQAPAGNHIAVCYQIIDLGMQKSVWQGQESEKWKVRVSWELTNEKMEDGRPFSVSKKYTVSLHENAALRKDLESWRGRAFTQEELAGFDISKLLGVPAMVNVVHNQADSGKTYVNVDAVAPIPKGMDKPTPTNELFHFDLDNYTDEQKKALPDWMHDAINFAFPRPWSEKDLANQSASDDFEQAYAERDGELGAPF